MVNLQWWVVRQWHYWQLRVPRWPLGPVGEVPWVACKHRLPNCSRLKLAALSANTLGFGH